MSFEIADDGGGGRRQPSARPRGWAFSDFLSKNSARTQPLPEASCCHRRVSAATGPTSRNPPNPFEFEKRATAAVYQNGLLHFGATRVLGASFRRARNHQIPPSILFGVCDSCGPHRLSMTQTCGSAMVQVRRLFDETLRQRLRRHTFELDARHVHIPTAGYHGVVSASTAAGGRRTPRDKYSGPGDAQQLQQTARECRLR